MSAYMGGRSHLEHSECLRWRNGRMGASYRKQSLDASDLEGTVKRIGLIAALVLTASATNANERAVIKAVRLNSWQTVVSCVTGNAPDVTKLDGVLVLTCRQ